MLVLSTTAQSIPVKQLQTLWNDRNLSIISPLYCVILKFLFP